jgi:hypothetical protein
MASTYSDRLKLELMETGANANTWGNNTNTNLETLDAFTAGYLSKSVAGSANVTLTTANADPTAEASNKVIDLNGALSGDIHVFIPAVESQYTFFNNTSGSQTLTIAATGHAANGVAITQGAKTSVYCDGSANFNVEISGSTDAGSLTGTLNNARLSGVVLADGSVDITGAQSFTANVNLGDNDFINFGAGTDMLIGHDGANSIIKEQGGGNLLIQNNANFEVRNEDASEIKIKAITDGQVELYHNNVKMIETTANGIQISNGGLGVGTDAGTTDGQIRATDDITAFYSSDVALKENIHNIESPMDKVQQLNGVLFDWKEDYIKNNGGEDGYFVRKTDVGVIAQDVEKVLPEVVGTRPNGVKAVKYDRLCALLIECVKDLQSQVNDLKKGE